LHARLFLAFRRPGRSGQVEKQLLESLLYRIALGVYVAHGRSYILMSSDILQGFDIQFPARFRQESMP
jgi:hypothetical protein